MGIIRLMKNIVILGAGFGGLRAAMVLGKKARRLAKLGYEIILIDRNDYHTYTPTLYEISTTSKETANYTRLKSVVTFSIKELLNRHKVSFRQATIEKIDPSGGKILLEGGDSVAYEHLILALGSEINYFDIDGLAAKSLSLKSFTDALKIRDAVWNRAAAAGRMDAVEVVVGGGGSTGVELAAELQEWFAELRREGISCKLQTTVIDAAPHILSTLDQSVAHRARRRLEKLGARIINNARIERVRGNKLTLSGDTHLRFDVLIWAGGIKPSSLLDSLPLKFDGRQGLEVTPTMKTKPLKKKEQVHGKIYAIGDAAFCKYPGKKEVVPKVARAAISQGTVAARNIIADITGAGEKVRFKPMTYPYIVPTGGKHAVAKVGSFIISGIWGWFLKGLVELNYLVSIMPLTKALSAWLRGLRIFIQNDRLG